MRFKISTKMSKLAKACLLSCEQRCLLNTRQEISQ